MTKRGLISFLLFLSVIALVVRFSWKPVYEYLMRNDKAGIRVLSVPSEAKVFLNGEEVGKTSYETSDLKPGEYLVKVVLGDASWEGRVRLNRSTLSVVNRDLTKDITTSAGEVLTLNKGIGLTIISSPAEAEVEVNGKFYGKTPTAVDVPSGEHTIVLSKGSYLKRSIKSYLSPEYNLTISVDLALSEADLSQVSTPVITTTPLVVVKSTPTGFLRVREKASTASLEISRVSPGDELILLEELASWDRVRLPDGKEGYVSKAYLEKKAVPSPSP